MNAAPSDSLAASAARPLCARCRLPLRACLCRWITPTDNRVDLLVLQHPLEQHQAKGSARLLALSLGRCRIEVGECFDADTLRAWLSAPAADDPSRPRRPLLLYPADAAGPGTTGPAATPAAPLADLRGRRLVLLDGTWRKTRKLLHRNPLLQRLPRWSLAAPPASRYAIRKAQRPEQRSTLEAACLALAALEGDAVRYEPLLSAFDGWVAAQRAWPAGAQASR